MRRLLLALPATLCAAWTAPGPAELVPVDQPRVCFQCHADMEDRLEAPHVHTAFAGGRCSQCHNPHASPHASLLRDDPGELCLSCHEDVRAELARGSVHPPAAAGECGVCHEPHASSFPRQLLAQSSDLCGRCHASVAQWRERKVIHPPVAEGDCSACHAPHGASQAKLLARQVSEACFDCHAQDQAFLASHEGRDLSRANCAACHDPHASDLDGLLRRYQHAPFAGGGCNTCHSGARSPFELVKDVRDLCEGCHRGTGEFSEFAHHHNLDDPRSCLNCHNPHTSNVKPLLAAQQKELCMRCHFEGSGFPKPKSDYLTHGGIECTSCHMPHGSDDPRYLRSAGVELCAGCHARAHAASHPVGPEVIDPRTDRPVTCLSCHRMHGSDFEDYLPLDPAMDLCIQCHRK